MISKRALVAVAKENADLDLDPQNCCGEYSRANRALHEHAHVAAGDQHARRKFSSSRRPRTKPSFLDYKSPYQLCRFDLSWQLCWLEASSVGVCNLPHTFDQDLSL